MKEHHCLHCDKLLDAATIVPGFDDHRPVGGDVSICLKCGHIAIFTRGGKLREPRPDELREIMTDQLVNKTRTAMSLLHLKGRLN
jgi:hypothetical protein